MSDAQNGYSRIFCHKRSRRARAVTQQYTPPARSYGPILASLYGVTCSYFHFLLFVHICSYLFYVFIKKIENPQNNHKNTSKKKKIHKQIIKKNNKNIENPQTNHKKTSTKQKIHKKKIKNHQANRKSTNKS